MPSITVSRTGVTAKDVADALSKQLGNRYKIVEKPGKPDALKVSSSSASTAHVHIAPRPTGTHLSVHGGGFIIGRVINELLIARKVATALRQSPDLAGSPAA